MTEPDDLFSFLDEPSVKPARPNLPNLADSLRDEGLLPQQGKEESVHTEVQEAEEQSFPTPATVDPSVPDEIQPETLIAPVEIVVEMTPPPVVLDELEADEQRLPSQPPMSALATVSATYVAPPSPIALSPNSRLPRKLIAASGVAIGFTVVGWLLASYIHKESAPPISVHAPRAVETTPAPVLVVEPAPEPIAASAAPVPDAVKPPMSEHEATPPQASPKRTPQPKAASRENKSVDKPKPKPEPQWQDDAMDALDDLEKRL